MAGGFNFRISSSKVATLEICQVERMYLPRDFVLPGPSLVYLSNFSGSMRINEVRARIERPDSCAVAVPDGGSFILDSIAVPCELHIISSFRQNFLDLTPLTEPRLLQAHAKHQLVSLMDELFNADNNRSDLESLHEAYLACLEQSFRSGKPLSRGQKIFKNAVEMFKILNSSPTSDSGIGHLCQRLGVHVSQISREFRKVYGVPPYRYWLLLRLAKSRIYLASSSKTTSVGHEFGFADQSHFIRSFRRFTYMTPKQYQQVVNRL